MLAALDPRVRGDDREGGDDREERRDVRFAGYAALFDRPDRSGDVVRKGAFARAVKAGPWGVPLLWQHDPARPIGRVDYLAEDARGLRVIGRLSARSSAAREAAAMLGDGAVNGLSFGYRVRGAGAAGAGRELTDLELVEVSLVTFPMQPLARVHMVRSDQRGTLIRDLLHAI